jgi:hypothetical protein
MTICWIKAPLDENHVMSIVKLVIHWCGRRHLTIFVTVAQFVADNLGMHSELGLIPFFLYSWEQDWISRSSPWIIDNCRGECRSTRSMMERNTLRQNATLYGSVCLWKIQRLYDVSICDDWLGNRAPSVLIASGGPISAEWWTHLLWTSATTDSDIGLCRTWSQLKADHLSCIYR